MPLAAAVLSLLASAAPSPALTQDAQTVYAKSVPSIMTVIAENRDGNTVFGSGFLAIAPGLAVTAWHVVDDAKKVTVRFSDGEEFDSTGIVDHDPKRDIALIRIRIKTRPMLKLAASDPAIGSKAYVIGAPKGLEFSISEGIVSSVRQKDGMKQYQFTASSNPGNSGGPVLGSDSSVLGVVSYGLKESETLNFAIPFAYVDALDSTLASQTWGTQAPVQRESPAGADTPDDETTSLPEWVNSEPLVKGRFMEQSYDAPLAFGTRSPSLRLYDLSNSRFARRYPMAVLGEINLDFVKDAKRIVAGSTTLFAVTEGGESLTARVDKDGHLSDTSLLVNVTAGEARARWRELTRKMTERMGTPTSTWISDDQGSLTTAWFWHSGYTAAVTLGTGERGLILHHNLYWSPPTR